MRTTETISGGLPRFAAFALDRTLASAFGRAALAAARIVEIVVLWQERSGQRRALAALEPHLLKDVGLSQAEAAREVAKPFWRA